MNNKKLIGALILAFVVGWVAAPNPVKTTETVTAPANYQAHEAVIAKDNQIFSKTGEAFGTVSDMLTAYTEVDLAAINRKNAEFEQHTDDIENLLAERLELIKELPQ